jgi:hypothetical protein
MCRRAAILWDIDKKTVKEIASYLKRSYRIYYILLVNALYNAGFNFYFHNHQQSGASLTGRHMRGDATSDIVSDSFQGMN